MKGRIFIAWSGKNDIAKAVRENLVNHGYEAIVGGKDSHSKATHTGTIVIDEINSCDQAIILVQKKDDGRVSGNLLFEYGYCLAKYSANKIHIYLIDIADNDDSIPSDLRGTLVDLITTTENENLIDDIVEAFLKDQKHTVPESKMNVINNYYNIKHHLKEYHVSPCWSEFELAQYIMFFSHASYLFKDEKGAFDTIRELSNNLAAPCEELAQAINLSLCNVQLFLNIKKSEEVIYITKQTYRSLNQSLKELERKAMGWEQTDFSHWFLTFLYDVNNYAQILCASCPELEPERAKMLLNESLEFVDKCLAQCDELDKNSLNQSFIKLIRAYMYRNRSLAYKALGYDRELIKEAVLQSSNMRWDLWNGYREARRINSTLFDSFEMEHFLALSEKLEFIDDDWDRDDSIDECNEYVTRVKDLQKERTHFIDKIKNNTLLFKK